MAPRTGLRPRAYQSPVRVNYVRPRSILFVLALYATAGLVPASIVGVLAHVITRVGIDPKWGEILAVNLAAPVCFVAAAAWYPRLRLLPLEPMVALSVFTLTRALGQDWHMWRWTIDFLVHILEPPVVGAYAFATVLALPVIATLKHVRRVGHDPARACTSCGYSRDGHGPDAARPCPECGVVAGHSAASLS